MDSRLDYSREYYWARLKAKSSVDERATSWAVDSVHRREMGWAKMKGMSSERTTERHWGCW